MHDGVSTVQILPSLINMCKDVFISNNLLYRLFDTGSQLTLLPHSAQIKLDAPSWMTNTYIQGLIQAWANWAQAEGPLTKMYKFCGKIPIK